MAWRHLRDATPFEHVRIVLSVLLVACGGALLIELVVPQYDRALVLSGRTEVLSMRLDDAAFGVLQFDAAIYKADPDTAAQRGSLQLDVAAGTTVRLVRLGRGSVRLTFAAEPGAPPGQCQAGLRQVGTAAFGDTVGPLCDAANVVVPLAPGSSVPLAAGGSPLVIGLSGGIVVGEEVSQGAGPRPLLLDATASLLVKHGNRFFRTVCSSNLLEGLCDRFVASSVVLSPGDSVRADGQPNDMRSSAGLGFVRIDPDEDQSGMLFNLAAPARAFQVQRMQGEAFTVRESMFDVIEKSPVVRALNVLLVALGLPWYFLRLSSGGGDVGLGALLPGTLILGTLLRAPGVAQAQQALLRADETGQALLRSRGDRCYAVTPSHVLGGETSALVTAPGRERGEGDLLRRIPAAPEAIALITLRGIPLSVCPAFEGAVSLDDLLRAHAEASLQLVRADGSIDRVPLLLGSIEVETLEVRSEAGSLEQGMSGGTVLVADRPVGLLVDVTEAGHVGRVARLDRVFERLAPHLTNVIAVEAAHAPVGSVAYDIARSNAAPMAPENKISSLQGDGPGPWRVSADRRVEVVFKVAVPISGVALDLTGLADPPKSVEILGGRSEAGPWQPLTGFTLEPGDALQERRFPPVALSYILLRAYAPAARPTLAILHVSFLPK